MLIENFKNNSLVVLDKYLPDYVIPFSFVQKNIVEFENVLFMFYSIVNNNSYFDARFYYSASFEENINSQDILNKDFCGFFPNGVIIFKTDVETAEKLIEELKATPLYKNNYNECL